MTLILITELADEYEVPYDKNVFARLQVKVHCALAAVGHPERHGAKQVLRQLAARRRADGQLVPMVELTHNKHDERVTTPIRTCVIVGEGDGRGCPPCTHALVPLTASHGVWLLLVLPPRTTLPCSHWWTLPMARQLQRVLQ